MSSAAASARSARSRAAGIPICTSRSAAGSGNSRVTRPDGDAGPAQPPGPPASAEPYRSVSRSASRRAAGTETCCPSTARTAISAPSTWPGTRSPGALRDQRPEQRVGTERRLHRRPGRRPGRAAAGTAARPRTGRARRPAAARSARARRRPTARRRPARAAAAGSARTHRPCTSSTPGTARAPRKRSSASRSSGARYGSRSVIAPAGAAVSSRRVRRSRVGVTAKTSRTVSLNCRTLAKPAAKATSVTGRSVVSSSTRAVCARCARATAIGPAPTSATSCRCRWRWL